jgi:hypothetical protein
MAVAALLVVFLIENVSAITRPGRVPDGSGPDI